MDDTHQFGTGFALHKGYESCVKEFNQVSERMCTIPLDTKPLNTLIINIECKENIKEKEFYEDSAPRNTVRFVIGDFNAIIRRETSFRPIIRLHRVEQ